MKKLVAVVLVLLVAVLALGYFQGWFSVSKDGVQVDAEKFKKDKAAFSKTVSEKTKSLRDKVAKLWKSSEALTGDDKTHTEKELAELQKKHDRLESQLHELDQAHQDKFGTLKEDLTKSLDEVEHRIAELTKKLEKGTEK